MRGAFAAAMAGVVAALLVLHCGGDGSSGDDSVPLPEREGDSGPGDAGVLEATVDDGDANGLACDPKKPFGPPAPLAGIWDSTLPYATPRLSADELTIYFTTHVEAGSDAELSRATRKNRSAPFGKPEIMLVQSSTFADHDPSVSADHLSLWFRSDRAGNPDIWTATRLSTAVDFGLPSPVTSVNTPAAEAHAYYRQSASELWFVSTRVPAIGFDIYVATQGTDGGFGPATPVAALDSDGDDFEPQPSEDGLTVLLASSRDGGKGGLDLYLAKRAATGKPFAITALAELNSTGSEQAGWLSADQCRIYFSSDRSGTNALYTASRPR